MSKVEKYIVRSPFHSKGKVFAKLGEILTSKDISEHDIPDRLKGGYIEKIEETIDVKESEVGFFNTFKKKRKRI